MFHCYNILLLCLFFTCSLSIDIKKNHSNRTIVPSRTIYDLVQIRMAASRFAASRNRTHRNISTNNFHPSEINSLNIDNDNIHVHQNITDGFINNYNRFINERLRAIIIVSSSALTFMIIVVIICIIRTYLKNNYPISMTVTEQTTPLNPSRKTNKTVGFSQSNRDTKNFSRKSRTLPVNV